MNSLERDLVEGLDEFLETIKRGESVEKKYTSRGVVLDLEPGDSPTPPASAPAP